MITVLVTGVTGTIGSQVLAALADKDVKVRAAVRSPEKFSGPKNATPVAFEYEKPETVRAAVQGVDKIFLVMPFVPNQEELSATVIDAAKAAGVKHIVKLSAFGCELEPGIQLGRWHRAVEKRIEASGIPYTFLRPNNFMENFINYYPPTPDGKIYLPLGEGAVSWIAARDIGEVAARVLLSEGHENKAYTLTGPEALTVAQVAKHLSEASGRTIEYVDVPEEAARQSMLNAGMPEWAVNAMAELNAIDKAGYAASVDPSLGELLGRAPTTFAEFAKEKAARFKGA